MRKKHRILRHCLLLVCLIVPSAQLKAETFRVHALVPLAVPALPPQDAAEDDRLSVGMNDALALTLPDDLTYINGIELRVKIPEEVAAWRDTIAYSLYDDIEPKPSADEIDYTGTRISVNTFPGKLSLIIYIPIAADFAVKKSPYHVIVDARPDISDGFVFLRLQLAMKGAPESFERAQFELSARPVLRNLGKLALTVTEPKDAAANYHLFIDGEAIALDGPLLLEAGEHHLSLTSEAYRDEVRTFRIEQARTTALAVQLRGIEPTVRVVSPENAQVYFDGILMEDTRDALTVTAGDHSVRFVIGDYEVTKTVQAVNGRSYTVSLSLDAEISETE